MEGWMGLTQVGTPGRGNIRLALEPLGHISQTQLQGGPLSGPWEMVQS